MGTSGQVLQYYPTGKNDDFPWSATFISYIMRKAGAGDRFKFSTQHSVYIREAIKAREKGNKKYGFWGFRLSERALEVGDLAHQRTHVAALSFCSFHLHLLGDLVGSRGPDGYQWPIPYLVPWSDAWQLTWQGQWALNAWPNFLITGVLLAAMFYLAWQRDYSPVEIISTKADAVFIATLRARFGTPGTSQTRKSKGAHTSYETEGKRALGS